MPAVLPVVLTFSACDPTGGAGLQADLLAITGLGGHAATVVTGYTVQDTAGVEDFVAIDADHIDDQARTILEDMPVAAFKIGVLGDVDSVAAVAEIVSDYPDLPIVLDPVMASGRGDVFADDDTLSAIRQLLLPLVTLVTPNSYEVRRLAAAEDGGEADGELAFGADAAPLSLEAAAAQLIGWGAGAVLVTGTHENSLEVVNRLFVPRAGPDEPDSDAIVLLRSDAWRRLPGSYHGSGCTLAAAIAALLARGIGLEEACRQAQEYTWHALEAAFRPGMGQLIPDRFFWMRAPGGGWQASGVPEA